MVSRAIPGATAAETAAETSIGPVCWYPAMMAAQSAALQNGTPFRKDAGAFPVKHADASDTPSVLRHFPAFRTRSWRASTVTLLYLAQMDHAFSSRGPLQSATQMVPEFLSRTTHPQVAQQPHDVHKQPPVKLWGTELLPDTRCKVILHVIHRLPGK